MCSGRNPRPLVSGVFFVVQKIPRAILALRMKKEARNYYKAKREAYGDHADRLPYEGSLDFSPQQKVHISGICGKFMASFAGILQKLGYQLTGSDDTCYPPMSTVLEQMGVPAQEYQTRLVDAADVVVVANVAGPSHLEAAHARATGKPYFSAPEFLGRSVLQDTCSIVIAGTHGKTTTTSIAAHVFSQTKENTGFLVGGVLNEYETSWQLPTPKPDYFVIEGDEYDTAYFDKGPKFLHYAPDYAIITSVERDHVDIYKDDEDYWKAFEFLAQEIDTPKKTLIICDQVVGKQRLVDACDGAVRTYGLDESSDMYAKSITYGSEQTTFEVVRDGRELGAICVPLSGEYNVLNALAVADVALAEGVSFGDLANALASFPGVKQRQQTLFSNEEVTILRDFAHHPTAVHVTLEGLRKAHPDAHIVCVFEPRSNSSRRLSFFEKYLDAFSFADSTLLLQPPFRHNDDQTNFISISNMAEGIRGRGKDCASYANSDELLEEIVEREYPNVTIIVFMSNASMDLLDSRFVDMIEKKYADRLQPTNH